MTAGVTLSGIPEPEMAQPRSRMTVRRAIFWLHLAIGSVIGVVVFFLAATGSLMAFETQIVSWAEREAAPKVQTEASVLGMGELMRRAAAWKQNATPGSVTLYRDRNRPMEVGFGAREVVLVDVNSGEMRRSSALRGFFATVRELHRWLALKGVWRERARAAKGAVCVALLLQIVAGFMIWVPRKLGWPQIRAVALPRPSLRKGAFEWNVHNVVGIWIALPFLTILVCGLVLAYPWATRLVYLAAGTPLPPVAARAGSDEQATPKPAKPEEQTTWDQFDSLVTQAEKSGAGWTSLSFRLPSAKDALVVMTLQDGENLPQAQTRVTLNRATGEVVRREAFEDNPRGRRWRMYARYVHTGQAFGWIGQLVALLTCLGVMVLVWSGLSLAVRRGWAWKERRVA